MLDVVSSIDAMWLIFCASLVLFMQGGFLCVESGLTRSKNSINVALKNVMDLLIAIVIFWAIGFSVMFGGYDSDNSLSFFPDFSSLSLEQASFFLFQMTFCATAATIVSGAIAERARFDAYILLTILVCVAIYPVFGQWVWGGALGGDKGWLETNGFVDFAGGTVVHSVGGWVSLAAIIVIGPRLWRFHNMDQDKAPSASNLPMAMLGIIFFLVGWIGFNGGNTLGIVPATSHIIANTLIAASVGGLVSVVLSYIGWISINPSHSLLNGILSGLVAITAGCYAVTTAEAALIGGIGAVVCAITTLVLWMYQLDDPVGAVPVHLSAGIWGTLAVGLFGDPEILATGLNQTAQIFAQVQGIVICGVYVFCVSLLLLSIINKIKPLRVSREDEEVGLNVSEHNASTELYQLVSSMEYMRETGDLSQRVDVEPFSETGYLARCYNQLIDALEAAINRTALVVNDIRDAVVTFDAKGIVESFNPSAEYMFGINQQDMVGQSIACILHEKTPNELAENPDDWVLRLVEEHPDKTHEMLGWKQNGEKMVVELSAAGSQTSKGLQYTAVIRDITERKQMEAQVQSQTQLAQVTLESIREAVVTCNKSTEIIYLNPQAQHMIGCTNEQVYKKAINEVIHLKTLDGKDIDMGFSLLSSNPLDQDLILYRKDKKNFTVICRWSSLNDENGENSGYVLALRDVSRSRKLQKQLSFQAKHDPLTGLVNRRAFEAEIDRAIASAKQHGNVHVLCYIDLDQFKIVNDTCGHKAGDELLKQLSKVLSLTLRQSDTLGRLGGDEFAILMHGCRVEKGIPIAEALRKQVEEFRFSWKEQQFSVGASIGLVAIDDATKNVSEIMAQADTACYAAKDLGRNRVHVYTLDDVNVAERKGDMQWANRLRRAIDEGRFRLYSQVISPAKDVHQTDHYEIFVRMVDDDGSIIPPGAFIPAAERYDLMTHIDRWVIKNTLSWMRDMQTKGQLTFQCSINLSGSSVGDESCLKEIQDELDNSRDIATKVCFEITETAAMLDTGKAQDFIRCIKDLGCQFSLDDFGSGLSSFAYLKNLNVDFLKIDGVFVRDIQNDKIDRAMVDSINTIGHVMGLKTIAEFVENEGVLNELNNMNIDYVQGYYVGKPVPIESIEDSNS